MRARTARTSRLLTRRAALATFALPVLAVACGGAGEPVSPARVTATTSGSAVAGGRFALATLIPATPEPVTPTAPPTAAPRVTTAPPTAPRTSPTTTINAVTPTPRPGGPSVVPGTAPVRGTNPPGPTAGPPGALATYADPTGGVRLQYPANWQATLPTSPNDSAVRLASPNDLLFSVNIFAPEDNSPTPTTDDVAMVIRDSHTRSQQYIYTDGMLQDVTVAGERGKYLEYSFVERANRTASPRQGAYWIIPRGDRMYVFQASHIGNARGEVEMILTSVMFANPRPAPVGSGTAGTRAPSPPPPASPTARPASTATPTP